MPSSLNFHVRIPEGQAKREKVLVKGVLKDVT